MNKNVKYLVKITCVSLFLIRIIGIGVDPSVAFDEFKSFLHDSTITTLVVDGITVY